MMILIFVLCIIYTTRYFCEAEDWVYCINANCDAKPTVDANLYGGKPYVNCACWEQSTRPASTPGKQSTFSILPMGTSGANCVLDNMEGGEEMCEAMKGGALVSTFGPFGWKPNTLESAVCLPRTPWYVAGEVVHCSLSLSRYIYIYIYIDR